MLECSFKCQAICVYFILEVKPHSFTGIAPILKTTQYISYAFSIRDKNGDDVVLHIFRTSNNIRVTFIRMRESVVVIGYH